MNDLYGQQHLSLQEQFGTRNLADRVEQLIVRPELEDPHKGFIETRDMLFLTTVDHRGYPTCSYKGGAPGFVKAPDSKTIVFPSYNGNGMFLSMGNLGANPKVGLLFIDFTTPHRIRVHGVASIDRNDPFLAECPGAELMVRVTVTEVFVNCPRYIHQYQRLQTSKYVPQAERPIVPPQWKRIDAVQDALPEYDKHLAKTMGGTITPEEYGAMLQRGEG